MKKINFAICHSLCSLPLISTISCSSNNELNIDIKQKILPTKEQGKKEIQHLIDNDELLINDIYKYANDDSILFYNVSYIAIAHKYIPLAHMFNVLQLNPQKQIYFFANTKRFKPNLQEILNSKIYPNLHYIEYDDEGIDIQGNFPYGYNAIKEYKKVIQNDKLNINKIVLTSDEYFFLNRLKALITNDDDDEMRKKFDEDYSLFFDFKEINMIADGTASIHFFSNNFFSYMAMNEQYFKLENNQYQDAIKFCYEFRKLNTEEKTKFILHDKYNNIDLATILFYLIISSKNNNYQDITRVNFYVPALEMILDANNPSSSLLNWNDKYNLFYNPYNTHILNFIKLIANLNIEKKEYIYFLISIGLTKEQINELNQYEILFNDHYNVVYSGGMVSQPFSLDYEVNNLISIYQENYDKKDKLQIWFKGHPRDIENYNSLIKNRLKQLGFNDISESIKFFNKTLPMETLICKEFMKTDLNKNRIVNIYGSYSTINLYLFGNKQQKDLKRIIVADNKLKEIKSFFGNKQDSILFNEQITISSNQFKNMYSFITKIKKNKNYIEFNDSNNYIAWNAFEKYYEWPIFARLYYQITITINNKDYVFNQINPLHNSNKGLKIENNNKIEEMFLENKNLLKTYNVQTYMNDKLAMNTMDYNINLFDQKITKKYLVAKIKIEYKNSISWSLFSNINDFILLKNIK